jgi:hypothetical protein
MLGGWVSPSVALPRAQFTDGGTSLVQQGNQSGRLVAPSGVTRGIPFIGNKNSEDGDTSGKLGLTLIGGTIVLLVVGYAWTRNVQGGG